MARLGHRGGIRVLLLGAAIVAFVIPPASVEAAGTCATPGRDGTATLNSVINTYYPGALTAAAGATTITLGTATGAGTPIAVGDLVVVIQMQDAAIDSANTGAYGNGIAGDPASGWTGLNSAGLYEYAVATSAVPLVGGALTISSGLLNTYTSALPTPLQGQRNFQVIRVPQYVAATLAGGLAAGAFNGSTGGVLVFDVDGALNLNGAAVSVSQEGFRAGLGRQLAGGAGGTGTDYVNLSANNFHAQKGEGIAGTPQHVFDSRTGGPGDNLVHGDPHGSPPPGAPAAPGGGGAEPHPCGQHPKTRRRRRGRNGGRGDPDRRAWRSHGQCAWWGRVECVAHRRGRRSRLPRPGRWWRWRCGAEHQRAGYRQRQRRGQWNDHHQPERVRRDAGRTRVAGDDHGQPDSRRQLRCGMHTRSHARQESRRSICARKLGDLHPDRGQRRRQRDQRHDDSDRHAAGRTHADRGLGDGLVLRHRRPDRTRPSPEVVGRH